ncbi:hypothetical protein D3C72_2553990 [compost metagenome]
MPLSAGTTGGITGFWNGPVAATTFLASITPSLVLAMKPEPSGLRLSDRTSTPQRIGASICLA